ncbi:hypothetical protein SporoP8_00645 [Sporosarcina ureae]|nr:hypothetical protein SporoP8_00645 [Sporosarcina ureae]
MQSRRSLGILSFITLIVGFILVCVFIFTGDFFIAMPFGYILIALSFGLSFFSRKDKFGRVSFYALPIIATIYLLFIGVMYIFWDTP